jgi:exodeoxyribonuclease V alpha subunit
MLKQSLNWSTALDKWVELHHITELDKQFAHHMRNLEPNTDDLYTLLCLLASAYVSNQQTCVPLNAINWNNPLAESQSSFTSTVTSATVLERIHQYHTIGTPTDHTPLILEDDRLYLHRYHRYEHHLCQKLIALSQKKPPTSIEPVIERLQCLFPNTTPTIDWQKVAAITALMQSLTIITGGPGTGKTTTVAKILLLLQQQQPDIKIKMVAPTGKAATRLQTSIENSRHWFKTQYPQLVDALDALPTATSTIHRLLGVKPNGTFRFHANNPLDLDLLLIDEASMIDLPLMYHLFNALPRAARVIILGDSEQLASVEAGSVLSDLCYGLHVNKQDPSWHMRYSADRVQLLNQYCAHDFDAYLHAQPRLGNGMCVLLKSHRFDAQSGIGQFAHAINAGDVDAFKRCLRQGFSDTEWFFESTPEDALRQPILAAYQPYLAAMDAQASLTDIFSKFDQFRVLCAQHQGLRGVQTINHAIETWLARQNLLQLGAEFYLGRPILIEQNDYQLSLFNGDVGLILQQADDKRPMAYFQSHQGWLKYLPARLPKHQTCFAMTIHKSQGSEFHTVATVLPDTNPRGLLSRELLYTAITRAKKHHLCLGRLAVIEAAMGSATQRTSGIRHKIWSVD